MICRHPTLRVPIIGRWAMSAMLTDRCAASGASAGATNTIGSSSRGRTSSGPVSYGPMSMKVTSMSPVSTAWSSSAQSRDSLSTIWMPGHPARKVPRRRGRTLVPTLGSVPTRNSPCSPDASARRSVAAELTRARTARAWVSSISPAAVSRTGRGPPGRSNSGVPTMRSRVADLLAHRRLGVAELLGGLAEGAGLDHGHQGQKVPHLQAGPGGLVRRTSNTHDGLPTIASIVLMDPGHHTDRCAARRGGG